MQEFKSQQGGNKVKPSTENEIAGKVHEVKGKIKEKAGELTNDPDLEGKGIGEKIAGKVQNKIGHAQKVLGK
ncbi:MAG: CsbD family protein [Candidatus Acidiferrales bacterium]